MGSSAPHPSFGNDPTQGRGRVDLAGADPLIYQYVRYLFSLSSRPSSSFSLLFPSLVVCPAIRSPVNFIPHPNNDFFVHPCRTLERATPKEDATSDPGVFGGDPAEAHGGRIRPRTQGQA